MRGHNEGRKFLETALVHIREVNKNSALSQKNGLQFPPEDSHDIRVSCPLIHFLTVATSYPDNKLACEYSKGAPLVGVIQERRALTAIPRDAALSFEQWRLGFPARNKKIIHQLKKVAGAELYLE